MDKAEIRAKAEKLAGVVSTTFDCDENSHEAHIERIEAALTAVYDQGWDEGVKEAAGTAREILSLSRNLTASKLEAEVIRRLKNGKGV